MTNREAVLRIEDHMDVHKIGQYPHTKIAEALTIAITAIRALEQREQNEPLTLRQLMDMEGKPVYDADDSCWRVIESVYDPEEDYGVDSESNPRTIINFTDGVEMDFEEDFHFLYAREPKHEEGDTKCQSKITHPA